MPQGAHLGPVLLDIKAPADCKTPATYLGVLNSKGECKIGFGDMSAHQAITPNLVSLFKFDANRYYVFTYACIRYTDGLKF